MNATEVAQAIRHISGELAGGGDVATAVKQLDDLAEEIDPGSGAKLEAYMLDDPLDALSAYMKKPQFPRLVLNEGGTISDHTCYREVPDDGDDVDAA
jgi:hypothetical protein